jgi:signal peptidase I
MGTRLRVSLLLALPLTLLTASCGGSGKGSISVRVITIKQPSRTATYKVPSSAMEPTILCAKGAAKPGCTGVANDGIVVQEPAPRIQRGNIIVFRAPSEAVIKCGEGGKYVKRVIGLPGETVREDDHGFVWIRAPRSKTFHKLNEPYVTVPRRLADTAHFEQVWHVPPDAYFTMGDNRAESRDSRSGGGVHGAEVIGKVVTILRPG